MADELKAKGNKAFSEKRFEEAIDFFTQAINIDSSNHVFFSNRSACYASLNNYQKALEDAEQTIKIKSDWPKGYSRKGAALYGLGRLDEAADAYNEGLKIDPNNALLKKGLEDVENAMQSHGMEQMFNELLSGDLVEKCAKTKCAKYLAEPDFVQILKSIQANPSSINLYMKDQRVMEFVLSALMPSGVDAQFTNTPPPEYTEAKEAKPEPKPEPQPEPEPELTEEEKEKKNKREESDKEKQLGNTAYKKKDFQTALTHYEKAYELDDTNIAVLTNKAAVLYEMGDYDEAIKVCENAVDHGREIFADFKLIARAFHRIGNAYHKKGDFDNAIKFYNKSLAEHRTPQVLEVLRKTEKEKEEAAKLAYHDVAKADEARNQGNILFKEGKFSEAVKFYTEAIKRNEDDPRNWNNRATCYIKLMAISEAEKDADECIKRDPNFLKAYIRKAQVFIAKRETSKAIDMLNFVREKDTEKKLEAEVQQQMMKCYVGMNQTQNNASDEEIMNNARNNPEVASILSDPIMRSILEQMQNDPNAARDHLQNPVVAAKIRTLVDAGIIKLK
ncbi:chaperone activator Sti1 [Piromyces finnis]|uniref:Chaperone activator Sti1 n=1 Tax=Piromyces finnis TaxID=1754191 RepID=A0A1Y1V8Y2_9FUNG|nr:chaperone activator Sti1 [Piromyces finnis]|eukprot:ORX50065.1 chaperone activator Sti1 [Piromyces finnis]